MDRRNPWKRHFELCEVLLDNVLQRDPGSTRARVLLAEVLFSLSKPDAAIQQCREALRREPDCAEAHLRLGSLLRFGLLNSSSNTLLEEARWYLSQAIRLGGDSSVATWARNVLGSLDRESNQI